MLCKFPTNGANRQKFPWHGRNYQTLSPNGEKQGQEVGRCWNRIRTSLPLSFRIPGTLYHSQWLLLLLLHMHYSFVFSRSHFFPWLIVGPIVPLSSGRISCLWHSESEYRMNGRSFWRTESSSFSSSKLNHVSPISLFERRELLALDQGWLMVRWNIQLSCLLSSFRQLCLLQAKKCQIQRHVSHCQRPCPCLVRRDRVGQSALGFFQVELENQLYYQQSKLFLSLASSISRGSRGWNSSFPLRNCYCTLAR